MEENRPRGSGRGALIMKALAMQKERANQAANNLGVAQESPEPQQPRGRAALIMQCRKRQQSLAAAAAAAGGGIPSSYPPPNKPLSAPGLYTEMAHSLSDKLEELRLEKKPCEFKGSGGKEVPATANYIKLELKPGAGVFEYEVTFDPMIDSKSVRFKLVNRILESICKAKTFDGHMLYLPKQITVSINEYNMFHPFSNEPVLVKFIYRRQKQMSDCIQLYNNMFRRIMYILKYKTVGRHFFDSVNSFKVPQHKLELWPGYVVSVNEYADGIMLCLDVQHKVIRTQNALEVCVEIAASEPVTSRAKELIQKELIGSIVLTRYNNNTYVIHDIMWDATPLSTFEMASGKVITFLDYYKQQYDITIKDPNQPLLVHMKQVNETNKTSKQERVTLLVPELSHLTGLRDEMRADFRVMKDVAAFTRVTPNQRMNSLRKFIENVHQTPEAKAVLDAWGLRLQKATIDLKMRILSPENIIFGNDVTVHGTEQADWTSAAARNRVMDAIDLHSWLLFHTAQDRRTAVEFVSVMQQCSHKMGIRINKPRLVFVPDDKNSTYMDLLNDYIKPGIQLICIICPTSRDDRYLTIKKICCAKNPIASQVINSRTLKNTKRLLSITQKIALQINCKLGGSLWSVQFPFRNWMIVGIDVHHNKQGNEAVVGFVASMNEPITRYFSNVAFHKNDKELSDYIKQLLVSSLNNYRSKNNKYPDNIVIYRDGIGDGQLETCLQIEVQNLLTAMKEMHLENTKLLFIVVQKRIGTRIFQKDPHRSSEYCNPPPGTIVDDCVTRRYLYDFFLVPQNVHQGTVSPTHYIVLYNNTNIKPANVQRLTYKLCHMYYNWTGTVRVPAPCQYAHKVAMLIGQHVHTKHDPKLSNRLFYL